MRSTNAGLTVLLAITVGQAWGESKPMYPVGEIRSLGLDSGIQENSAGATRTVYEETVRVPGARWLRLYFGDVSLRGGGFVRVTSLFDGEVQELDAAALATWEHSTAYFNGDAVKVELVAGPGTSGSRLVIADVALAMGADTTGGCGYPCGICGADDRVSSSETWSARLLPAGCTASVYNEDSCMVSAGHCVDGFQGSSVAQFNVPASNPSCSINQPPVADQFPITSVSFSNGGVGNDWAAMTSGTNNLGQTAFERYGTFRPIATTPPSTGQALDIWGYGIDPDCTESQTQQTTNGSVTSVSSTWFEHNVDATCGNSGSAVVRSGAILGIATHCPCNNIATRVDHPSFAAARDAICLGTGPDNDNCADAVPIGNGGTPFSTLGATTDGPAHASCEFDGQTYNDIWFEYTATCTGDLTVSTCNEDGGDAGYDTDLVVYNGCNCGSLNLLGCNDDAAETCTASGTLFASRVVVPVTAGNCYLVRVGGWNSGDSGMGTVNLSCAGVTCTPPDCNDGNPCTTDVCNAGVCQHTNNTLPCEDGNLCTTGDTCSGGTCVPGSPVVCNDGNGCTVGDFCVPSTGNCASGSPPDCSGVGGECNTASCDPGGLEGNCSILTPANEGGPCGGGAGICQNGQCVLDPGATRVFLKRAGQPESSSISVPPGEIVTLEVFVADTDPQQLGGYQIALPGSATPIGATGTVSYVDTDPGPGGSVVVDTGRPDWVFAAEQPVPFYSETGLPLGFAFLATLPLGQGPVVVGSAYLGEFQMQVSPDACGSFTLAFLPDGSPPNGGSGLTDQTGIGQVAAFYQPLEIVVGPGNDDCADAEPLIGNNVSVPFDTNCATQDGVSHACGAIDGDVWFSYTSTCTGQLHVSTETGCSMDTALAVYRDGASCVPADADLVACANSAGACEAVSTNVILGDELLIRVGSIAGQHGSGTLTLTCTPVSEVTRVFMVPPGGEQSAPPMTATTLVMQPGETARIEIWLEDTDGRQLGGYQIALPGSAFPAGGATGTVSYVDIPLPPGQGGSVFINTADPDWAFAVEQPPVFYSEIGLPVGFAMIATLPLGDGPVIPGLAYLGEFDFVASSDACGTFTLNFLPDGAPPNGGSALVDQTGMGQIAATYQPLEIAIGPGNDDCTDAVPLLGNDVTVGFDTTCATQDGVNHSCGAIDGDVWYAYTSTCAGALTISTETGCAIDTAIALYRDGSSCTPTNGDLVACVDTPGACESLVTTAGLGDDLLIRVGSIAGDHGPGTLTVTCVPDAEVTRVFMVRAGEEQGVPATAPTVLSMLPGETVPIEVWIEDTDGAQLGSYQMAIPGAAFPEPGSSGTVTYVDVPLPPGAGGSVVIDTQRSEWVFFAEQPVPVYSEIGLPAGFAMIAGLPLGQGPVVPGLGYLGEFEFAASADACGTFALNFLPDGAPPNGGSALINQTGLQEIPATYQPLDVVVGPLNEACADATAATGPIYVADFNTVCAEQDGVPHACGAIDADIWYAYTAACTGDLTVDTLSNCAMDTAIAVYSAGAGCIPTDAQLAGCADVPGACESLTVPVTLGDTVLVRLGSVAGDRGPGTVTMRCGTPCVTADECGDADANGIVDDVCFFYSCESNVCAAEPRIFADAGGPFEACPPDGFANVHDWNHVLACFANVTTCDTINHDVGGPFGDCEPDGFCNIHDANHTLAAFALVSTCTCPANPAPSAHGPVRLAGTASLSATASRRTARPGDEIVVRIFVDDALADLQSYQLDVGVSGGRRGRLDLVDITIEERDDGVFGPGAGGGFRAFNPATGQMLRAVGLAGVPTEANGYLATYRYRVSEDAVGAFVVDVRREGETYVIATGDGKIDVPATRPAVIVVTRPPSQGLR